MKKIIGIGVVLLLVIVVILARVDFNRLGKDHVYVQIGEPANIEEQKIDTGEIITRYWYELPAYDEEGNVVDVAFSANKELRQEAYLKLYVKKENEVSSYDEVSWEEIPTAAQQELGQ
ncbi:YxeA family protein [Ornithinibacillus gellani]|uniref:YxeA family protein n=1 Tax=Ornithinibacillus gellani TaxID=2293253 RepID=UPI000F48641A|nr:YxeA family protein [Ornithinibacillus gellani]TQS71831.1 YxeA family protein [Ornithinibacillus gellani]